MPRPPTVGQGYVEELVFNFLDALRTSKDLEQRYPQLSVQVKRMTTARLRATANKAAGHLLQNTKSLNELAHLNRNELIFTALTKAIQENDEEG